MTITDVTSKLLSSKSSRQTVSQQCKNGISGDCIIGVGGWVVGPRSAMYTRHVYTSCIHTFNVLSNALSQQRFCVRSLSNVYSG